ncbi:oligosaccharide flippase family protein [Vibrio sp. 10N.222.54.F10]|uniref:lipopolysaccharide biosynthesis protein n=1 Tax=Vibrio sp. 10N.222.54.F10 TaxID=1884469 RepID=UPI000C850E4E|nr:oligosaccharide flippase family protein [Vibrio sp. 10N.222.54.F10]PMO16613.1 hypothetical protein BCT17_06725 [Vibrio sp. 10N.222.54.F10]
MLKRILIKSTPLLASSFLGAALTFFSAPLLINSLGLDGYGVYIALLALVQVVNVVFNIQTWQALINYWYQDKYIDKKYALLSKCIVVDSVSAGIGAVFFLITAGHMADFLKISFDNELYYMSALYIFFSQTSFSIGVFRLNDKFSLHAKLISVFSILRFVGVLIAVYFSFSPEGVLFIFLLIGIITNCVQFYIACRVSGFTLRTMSINNTKVIGFTRYSLWVNMKVIADLPVTHLDKIIITTFLGTTYVGLYDILKKCSALIGLAASPIGQVVLPLLTSMIESGKVKEAYHISIKYGLFASITLVPTCLFLGLIIIYFDLNSFLSLNDSFIYSSMVYISAQIVASSFVVLHTLFMALGMVKKDFVFLVFSNLIYLSICVLFVKSHEIMAFSLALLCQAVMVITFKALFIRKEVFGR